MDTNKKPTVKQVLAHCRALHVPCRRISETGEYKVLGYFTDDAQDAMDTATHLAKLRERNTLGTAPN